MKRSSLTRSTSAVVATAFALSLALPVAAATPTAAAFAEGDFIGKTVGEVATTLTAEGYDIREIGMEHGKISADAKKDGSEIELHIDPTTGTVKSVEFDD